MEQVKSEQTIKRLKKRPPLLIAIQFSAVIITIVTFFWYRGANQTRIVNQNKNYITDYTMQQALQLEQNMDDAHALVINAAHQYALLTELEPNMSILEKLSAIHDDNLFDRIVFVTPEGLDVNVLGQIDVSDREYYQKGMAGETGWQKLTSRFSGNDVLAFYAPVVSNDRIIGVLAGFYSEKEIKRLFSGELFHYAPRTYLVLKDGTVVAGSEGATKSGNILQGFSKEEFNSRVTYQDILEFVNDPSKRSISFSYGKGFRTSEATIVKPEHSDWMLLSVLPSSVTANMVKSVAQTGFVLLAVLLFLFSVILMSTLVSHRGQEKYLQMAVNRATADLQEALEEERKQQAIIKSLSSIYTEVYYISLPDRNYRLIQFQNVSAPWNNSAQIPSQGNIDTDCEKYMELLVMPEYIGSMREFLEIDTMDERMRKRETLYLEYQMRDGLWCRGTLVASERGEEGALLSFLFAVQIIQEEKEKELETQTALKEAYDAAQMANRAKTAFLSNMSHDMRTPMNAVIGMTTIAGSHLDDKERVAECLKKIATSGRHLLQLINDVLDLSKIEAGKVDLAEEEFSLSDLVENMLTLNHSHIAEHCHTLEVNLKNLVHENVVGDGVRLQQVFTNLLSNAAKYTPDNGLIRIVLTEKETGSTNIGSYEITFEDNGIGMSPEYMEHLFEPFKRSEKQVRKIQGTGLGMPIARNIIRMMDGDITVESTLGKGTKFTVTFCLKLQKESFQIDESFADLPVLLADDDPVARESAMEMLGSLGMNCECVQSGEEALERILESHKAGKDYYAVILDWKMEGVGGIDAAKAIRENAGEALPIIVISAYDWSDIEEDAIAAGVDSFIVKPLFKSRITQLFQALQGREKKNEPTVFHETIEKLDYSGKRVLLVEDNELNAEIAAEILGMANLSVEIAENGKVGVDMVSHSDQGYYDIVFMDVQMPVMDGYEATRNIRALERLDAKTLPIIAMTANAFVSDVQDAKNAGMNDHIAKPLEFDRLVMVLKKYLGT